MTLRSIELDNLGFSARFACELLGMMPATSDSIRFISSMRNPLPSAGLALLVTPVGAAAWTGWFEPDDPCFSSGVYVCPSGRQLLVVSEGNGYIVAADQPGDFSLIAGPVLGVTRIPDRRMIAVWTVQDLFAYDVDGERWWIERMAVDGLKVNAVTPDAIRGSVIDLTTGEPRNFSVNVDTGEIVGGWPRQTGDGGSFPLVHRY